ncbi:triosephosphate isomerase [Candidatus Collierbacteria bacterium]|nr:triosephosphate isomerase [Candidatus Collierbacteria bacterium]
MPFDLIVANWKANKNEKEVISWMERFSSKKFELKNLQVAICPPAVHFSLVQSLIQQHNLSINVTVGLQDVSAYPGGAYTGEITARMAAKSASYAILGHSERRKWFKETVQQTAQKVIQALDNNIIPIVSMDRENFRQQLGQFDNDILAKIMIMYEPPEAISVQEGPIGKGKSAEITDIEDMIKVFNHLAPKTKILYGGSVKSANITNFSSLPRLSGVVVGSASLNPDEFIKIIRQI